MAQSVPKVYTFTDCASHGEKCMIEYVDILKNIKDDHLNEMFGFGIIDKREQGLQLLAKYMFDNYPASGSRGDTPQEYRDLIARYNAVLRVPVVSTCC